MFFETDWHPTKIIRHQANWTLFNWSSWSIRLYARHWSYCSPETGRGAGRRGGHWLTDRLWMISWSNKKKKIVRNIPSIVSLFGPVRTHKLVVGSYSGRVNQIGPSSIWGKYISSLKPQAMFITKISASCLLLFKVWADLVASGRTQICL